MANNILKNFLGYLKLGDEEDYEDYIEDYDEKEEKARLEKAERERQREREERAALSAERRASRTKPSRVPEPEPLEEKTEVRRERPARMERTTNNKIVPIRTTTRGLEVCIMKPGSFEDSQDICDMLLSGRAVVVNLEGFDPDDAQRIMDFISGAVYAISGKLHQISRYIFIFSPDNIDISGDDLASEGFGVPTLSKEF